MTIREALLFAGMGLGYVLFLLLLWWAASLIGEEEWVINVSFVGNFTIMFMLTWKSYAATKDLWVLEQLLWWKMASSKKRWIKWCGNGCGKCVTYTGHASKLKKPYMCGRCGTKFSKEELIWYLKKVILERKYWILGQEK